MPSESQSATTLRSINNSPSDKRPNGHVKHPRDRTVPSTPGKPNRVEAAEGLAARRPFVGDTPAAQHGTAVSGECVRRLWLRWRSSSLIASGALGRPAAPVAAEYAAFERPVLRSRASARHARALIRGPFHPRLGARPLTGLWQPGCGSAPPNESVNRPPASGEALRPFGALLPRVPFFHAEATASPALRPRCGQPPRPSRRRLRAGDPVRRRGPPVALAEAVTPPQGFSTDSRHGCCVYFRARGGACEGCSGGGWSGSVPSRSGGISLAGRSASLRAVVRALGNTPLCRGRMAPMARWG